MVCKTNCEWCPELSFRGLVIGKIFRVVPHQSSSHVYYIHEAFPFSSRIERLILFYRLFVCVVIFGFSSILKLHCYIFVLLGVSVWFPWDILKPIFEKQNLGLIIIRIRAACLSMNLLFHQRLVSSCPLFSDVFVDFPQWVFENLSSH